jgi:hypothetical protein
MNEKLQVLASKLNLSTERLQELMQDSSIVKYKKEVS